MPRAGREGRQYTRNCVRESAWKQIAGYKGMGMAIQVFWRMQNAAHISRGELERAAALSN